MKSDKLSVSTLLAILLLTLAGCIDDAQIAPTVDQSAPIIPQVTQPVEVGVSDTPQPDLAGTSWVMTSVNGQEPVPGTQVTAIFTNEGTITGSAGCNDYTYAYETSQPNFMTVESGPTTQMACVAPVLEQETVYLRALDDAATYIVEDDTLTLTSPDGNTTVSYQVAPEVSLAGSSWLVTGYNNGNQAVVSVLAGTMLSANFNEDGSLDGSAGCNNYNATFTTKDSGISIEGISSTRLNCEQPPGIMEQETQYLAALETAVSYQIDGNQMEMRDAGGALAASFTSGLNLSFADITWQVVSYNNDNQEIVSPLRDTTLTATFGGDGLVTGDTGCGQFTAAYQTDGTVLGIGQPEVTRAELECNEDQIIQETEYTNALAATVSFIFEEDQLQLLDASGNEAVIFTRSQ